MSDGWSIVETQFRVEHNRAYEGLFALGSGYLHVRGSLEEHLCDAPQNVEYTRRPANVTSEKFAEGKAKWGTYVPGLFGRHPLLGNEMINLPHFTGIVLNIDGVPLVADTVTHSVWRRELRLDNATLTRQVECRVGATGVRVQFTCFISAARPHLCVQRATIELYRPGVLQIHSAIDANVRTNGFDHFAAVEFERNGHSVLLCRLATDGGNQLSIESHARAKGAAFQPEVLAGGSPSGTFAYAHDERCGTLGTRARLDAGQAVTFEKRTAVTTDRDVQKLTTAAILDAAGSLSLEQLHAEHAAAWKQRWDACDIEIEGDPQSQLAVRAALYHLLRCHPGDSRVAIDAKGYSGDAYWGRFFWDTEMFLLPFYLYTNPAAARTLTDFRVNTLPGARENAERYGYQGARYAWESDADGRECCPNWQYADHEVHITADVAYGLAHYAAASGDESYLRGPAAGVIVETALYWLERVTTNVVGGAHPTDFTRAGAVGLLGVMGPDEYTPISNNNAYTNRLVSFALKLAADVGPAGGATAAECEEFARIAAALAIPRSKDGLVWQCDHFDELAEPDFQRFWKDGTRTFGAQVSQERLYRSKCLKQADVLMLMMLFPHDFSDAEVRRAWDCYLPYTTHDSSLSAGIHAIVAARLGLDDEAWDFWQRGSRIDLDVQHGGAAEGIHIAAAGAVWQMVVFGFAGMRSALQSDVLTLHPRLPKVWQRVSLPLVWKGCRLRAEFTQADAVLSNTSDRPVTVQVGDDRRQIAPSVAQRWQLPLRG